MSAPTVERPAGPSASPLLPARRRHRLRVALVVLAVLVAVGVGWLVWFSPVFSVKAVRVVGLDGAVDETVSAQVLAAANVRLGTPLARLDADRAQGAVAQLPWIAAVEVRRGWPSEVVLAVTPRVPVARYGDAGEGVDAAGVVFEPVVPLGKKLPLVAAEGDGLGAAVRVLGSLPPALARRVVEVHAATLDDVELTLRSGDIVRWGSADEPERKATVLTALMKRKADLYDVSAPGMPTTFRSR